MPQVKTIYHFDRDYRMSVLKAGDTDLFQIGRRYCAVNEVIGPHLHVGWYELTVVTGGSGTITTGGVPCRVKPGDVYLSYPADIHDILADNGEKLEYDYFAFFSHDENLKRELELITQSCRSSTERIIRDDKISTLLGYALNEFTGDEKLSDKLLDALFTQIIIYVIRDFNGFSVKTPNVGNTQVLCAKISGYIDSHIFSMTELYELSEKFGYNYSYLSHVFTSTTGKTPGEYFREKKLEAAKILILENRKKISEIAEMLNYSSAFAFSKAFKNHFGVSPKVLQSEQKAAPRG